MYDCWNWSINCKSYWRSQGSAKLIWWSDRIGSGSDQYLFFELKFRIRIGSITFANLPNPGRSHSINSMSNSCPDINILIYWYRIKDTVIALMAPMVLINIAFRWSHWKTHLALVKLFSKNYSVLDNNFCYPIQKTEIFCKMKLTLIEHLKIIYFKK